MTTTTPQDTVVSPLITELSTRWSPRSFDPEYLLAAEETAALLEAARWAPSASNTQPWRFIITHRGTAAFDSVVEGLMGFNKEWAVNASLLVVSVAATQDDEGKPYRWAEYDLGQSVAHLSIQAQALGLHTHQMGGFVPETIRSEFSLDEALVPVSVVAVGRLGDPAALNDVLRERELAPRARRDLGTIILRSE
ncbi:nitroreductase family protein [Klugiella xanthotipulae]|uniref:Nitroreductase n=1 Tax=Klugiella xanthotipulae TaxID=244735 RepID=A0A543I5D4_9MICO|nr:nitroreductase family protein [Klugiella xanthotipulae]TQM65797.1 nitroreductase [Klugiella xanthotipulae]